MAHIRWTTEQLAQAISKQTRRDVHATEASPIVSDAQAKGVQAKPRRVSQARTPAGPWGITWDTLETLAAPPPARRARREK